MFSEKKYPKLKKINLSKNNFTSFIIFGIFPELTEINLSYNFFVELFPKKNKNNNENQNFNIKNIIYLDMSGNQLANLNGIQYFSKLKKLIVKENSISKIDTLDKMNQLDYLDVSFNKIRSCDKANLGVLPSLKTFLCDNNYLKDINCFEKFYSLEIISFNNNKINNFDCLEKLNQLKNLTQLSLINNPITKNANYRKNIIYMFQNLKILDNKEIDSNEKGVNDKNDNNSKDEEYFGNQYTNHYNQINSSNIINCNTTKNNNYVSQKNLKPRLNYVQIGYNLFPFKNNKYLSSSSKNKCDERKKTRNKTNVQMSVNLLKHKKIKNNEYKWALFLSDRSKLTNYLFPTLRKCSTLAKKNDIAKVKYIVNANNYNINGSAILFDKGKQNKNKNKLFQRPQSTTRIPSSSNNSKKIKYNQKDYFSIVLNSVNNDNNLSHISPLITMKNWNIKKIHFENRK